MREVGGDLKDRAVEVVGELGRTVTIDPPGEGGLEHRDRDPGDESCGVVGGPSLGQRFGQRRRTRGELGALPLLQLRAAPDHCTTRAEVLVLDQFDDRDPDRPQRVQGDVERSQVGIRLARRDGKGDR